MVTLLLTQKASDARTAMSALIQSRALDLREDEPAYAKKSCANCIEYALNWRDQVAASLAA